MYKLVIILLLMMLNMGCEDLAKLPEGGKYKCVPVIEAVITDQLNYQSIRVSYSTQLDDSISSTPISNANVQIISETEDTVSFNYTENGYYTSSNFIASPGKKYTLLVQIDTVLYRAASTMESMNGLDSVTYFHDKKYGMSDSAYYLKIFAGQTDPENIKYYRIQIYKNNKLFTTGNNSMLFNDKATLSLNGIELDKGFAKTDTLDIELYSLTKEMFYYHVYILNNVLSNANFNLDFKTNPTNQFNPKALGYFQVSSLGRKRIIIR
jgi:hypothetical protein